ncbi:MAG TPA: queuosine precursor transporter [Rectinema sp.]|nr:queuosine precursor transporter [Rectinema sp.]
MNGKQQTHSTIFLVLTALYITCLLISNIIASKLIQIAGIVLPSAVILFPVTYILADVFTEVYGFKKMRLVIWLGFGANAFMSLIFLVAIALPSPPFFGEQEAYRIVLSNSPRIFLASLAGYWAGEFSNSIILSALKKATKGRLLWTRTIASTIVGEGLDTILFIGIAFWGTMPKTSLIQMMLAQYLFKVAYEVAFTPFTYLVVSYIKRKENIDTFDRDVVYNPFRLGE